MFRDRSHAAELLVKLLEDHGVTPDVIAAIPRGGVPIGRAVADAFGVPLAVVVVKKIGAPDNPELALGAVTNDGTAYLNELVLDAFGLGPLDVEEATERSLAAARKRAEAYGIDADAMAALVTGKRVVVVDDGLATGATVRACCKQVMALGAASHVVAVPVADPDAVVEMQDEGCAVIAVETPPHFSAVGQFYESFAEVSDEEVAAMLDSAVGVRRGPATA